MQLNEIIALIDNVCDGSEEKNLGKRGLLYSSHPYIMVEYDGESIAIDKLIYPLVTLIWNKGIRTTACCQGDAENEAYISFDSLDQIVKFCNEFSYFKECGVFYVLNINAQVQGHKPLDNLSFSDVTLHTPVYGDLYSIRFNPELLFMFQAM